MRPSIEVLESRIAPALVVSMGGTDIDVNESAAGDDNVTFFADAANFHFFDPAGITAGQNAVQVTPTQVDVPIAGFTGAINIDTGLGNDSVALATGIPTIAGLSIRTQAVNPNSPFPDLTIGPTGNLDIVATSFAHLDGTVTITGGGGAILHAPVFLMGAGAKISTNNGGFIDISANIVGIDPTARITVDNNSTVEFSVFDINFALDVGGIDRPGFVGVSAEEIATISAGEIVFQTENTPITVSAPIIRQTLTDLTFLVGGQNNNLTFKGQGSLDSAGGKITLVGNAVLSGAATNDVIGGAVEINSGRVGIGTSANPFNVSALSLRTSSFGDLAKQFINSTSTTVNLLQLDAAGSAVTLSGGTFVAASSAIMGGVRLTVNSVLDLQGHDQFIAALNGSGTVTNSDGVTTSNLGIITNGTGGAFPGLLTGLINLGISGTGTGKQTFTNKNTFTGAITMNSGVLQINSDEALGNPNNSIQLDGGELKTTGSFILRRDIIAGGAVSQPVLNVASGTLVLGGTVLGNLEKTGAGKLLFGTTFTGQAPVAPNSTIVIDDTKVTTTGSGSVILTVVPDPINGGTRISSVELQDTKANSVLNIKSPEPITIDRIVSLDAADNIGTIKLGSTVTLGDGVNDMTADLDIHGKSKKLILNDISPFTRFELGKGLAYLDTYNNHPTLTLNKVLGTGVVIDATGNGIAGDQPGSLGGGGLGKVVVNQWSDPGIIQTTQSVKSFKLKNGDCFVTFSLDPTHLGEATTANIGQMSVVNGSWGSSGTVIEGTVGSFSAAEFLASADITAARIKKVTVKNGNYAGTTTLTDPSAKALGTFSVNGDYLGLVNAQEGVINVNVKGDFKGSLSAQFIGSISAYSFDGAKPTPGDYHQIIATGGSLGMLKTSVRGIKNFEIDSNTVFGGFNIKWPGAPSGAVGIDNVVVAAGQINQVTVKLLPQAGATGLVGIRDSIFESAASIGAVTSSHTVAHSMFAATTNLGNVLIKGDLTGSKLLAGTSLGGDGMLGGATDDFTPGGSVGNVTVSGMFASTTIAAGVDPASGFIYGDGDVTGTSPLLTGPSKIGALVFGTLSGVMGTSSGASHTDAIEAASIKSLKVGTGPTIKNFTTAQFLDAASNGEDMSDILVKLI